MQLCCLYVMIFYQFIFYILGFAYRIQKSGNTKKKYINSLNHVTTVLNKENLQDNL